ncbi:MAG: ParB/RepB/Spo0J family partition protein [Rhodospirillaceae bacterium]|jgi:ParB family transcriptional regulator, chromosome partitioning protein|nr:ParB/RepB/Spo0J family partition protein [Rhodospirillaceae bacterium]MBT5373726.1 ParB/RepB/Spo0J family partition protein [Rhodospirillaceae bacterium]MBT5658855.1 ParB/RepB/Spo0J family partition protein [Rhodospirillaceae bacterium]MBT5751725.1 ParB/RepB/Spo0J family partition protein [Rhodospirillaceae bacterium]
MSEEKEGGKRNLGKGLSALLGDEGEDYAELDRVRLTKMVPIEFVHPGKFQPRKHFDEEEIDGLVDSISRQGILQPILVRRHPDKPIAYEIIAGERRWRAAQRAKLHEIPVIIKDLNDGEALELALVENLQRQNLTPLEEADGYQRLIDEFSYTQEELGQYLGKSRSHVANMLRLIALPDGVKELLEKGALTAGHARALLGADSPETLARQVIKKGLNVRQTEELAQGGKQGKKARKPSMPVEKDSNTLALEKEMSDLLGLSVNINFNESRGGVLTVRYKTLEQLEDLLARLSHHALSGDEEAGALDEELGAEEPLVLDENAPEDDAGLAAMLGEDAETVEIADASGEEAITLEEAAAEETALEETAAEEIIASEEATTPEEDGDLAALLDEEPAMEEGGAQGASTYSSMDLDMEEETAEESGENTAV